jgi:fructose-1,6-bisphosphatase/inositol monophosphatase family enzyme
MVPDMHRVANLMREVAEEIILPRFQTLADDEIREKTGPKDLVTIADIEAERRLTPALKDMLPGSVVIGEEAVEEDPKLMDLLRGDAPAWIVDPVDGTSNFSKGSRLFCVMIALVHEYKALAGWILDPLGQRWIGAELGGGAWLHHDVGGSQRLTVPSVPMAEMTGALNFRFIEPEIREGLRDRADGAVAEHFRLGCAGHEYIRMVTGQSHFMMHGKNMPWDHVPGCLIHTEAGGYQARFDGRPYRASELEGGLLAAPDKAGWNELGAALFPKS